MSDWEASAKVLLPGADLHAIELKGFDDAGRSETEGGSLTEQTVAGLDFQLLVRAHPDLWRSTR
jgi:hypothetical protein